MRALFTGVSGTVGRQVLPAGPALQGDPAPDLCLDRLAERVTAFFRFPAPLQPVREVWP